MLTSIVLGRLVLLAGFSSSLGHDDCCIVCLVVESGCDGVKARGRMHSTALVIYSSPPCIAT